MQDFLLYSTNGLLLGVIYALSALGVSLIVGIMNVINFSHGELYVLAGYFSALFARALGLPVALAALLAVAGVFVFGLVVERTLIRNTYGNDMASLIITFVLSIVLQNAYLFIFGPYPQKPPNWVSGSTHLLGLFYYGNQRLATLGVGAAVIALFFGVIKLTWFGKTVRAVAQDREMAAMLGVNPTLVNMLSFGTGCALAGAAGVILSPIFPVTPTVSVGVSLTAFIVVVLGGMGSLKGCVVGGLVLGLVQNLGAAYMSSGYKHFFGFFILLLILVVRPTGLFGQKQL